MTDSDDELVSDYLRRLEATAAGMPADRRRELIEEITAHIAEARASLPAEPGGVRTVLDQLGSPEDIVIAAGATPYPVAEPSAQVGLAQQERPGPPGALEIVAVIALLIGGLIVPVIGWLIGVVLLWVSNSWRTRDKLLGTLVWPGGLLAPLVVFAVLGAAAVLPYGSGSSAIPPWLPITLAILVLLASIVGPIYVAIRLLRQARRPIGFVAQPTQGPLISSIPG